MNEIDPRIRDRRSAVEREAARQPDNPNVWMALYPLYRDTGQGVAGAVVRVGIVLALPFAFHADRQGRRRVIRWIMVTGVALMVLLYGALAPDVQKGEGQHWKKDAGFHHSFTTSKPHEAGEAHGGEGTHGEAAPAEGASH